MTAPLSSPAPPPSAGSRTGCSRGGGARQGCLKSQINIFHFCNSILGGKQVVVPLLGGGFGGGGLLLVLLLLGDGTGSLAPSLLLPGDRMVSNAMFSQICTGGGRTTIAPLVLSLQHCNPPSPLDLDIAKPLATIYTGDEERERETGHSSSPPHKIRERKE